MGDQDWGETVGLLGTVAECVYSTDGAHIFAQLLRSSYRGVLQCKLDMVILITRMVTISLVIFHYTAFMTQNIKYIHRFSYELPFPFASACR